MRSLRTRTIAGAVIWAVISTIVGAIALISILDAAADRRFNRILAERHLQVAVALATIGDPGDGIERMLTDPAYSRPYSGRYWQIVRADGAVFTSRSLFDATLADGPAPTAYAQIWTGDGPEGQIRGVRQALTLDDGSAWVVDVADSLSTLAAEQASLGRSILVSFALVGALGVAGALLLTTAILQPLGRLRHDLGRRSQSGADLSPGDYPEEVAPLVGEINDLLTRNQSVVERARRQSSDLAHALKTPSAALRNELEHLAATGQDVSPALDALARIDAQIGRSLARFRAESSRGTVRLSANVADARDRIVRLFRTMSVAQDLTFDIVPSPALFAAADQQDLEEIFGNLIENAAKWALGTIRISFVSDGSKLRISVEDDGPGIPEAERASVIGPGFRLDTAKPGTGLGLAIVSDLVHAYGGDFVLDRSDQLGGLRATVVLPRTDATLVKKPAATGTVSLPPAHTEVG